MVKWIITIGLFSGSTLDANSYEKERCNYLLENPTELSSALESAVNTTEGNLLDRIVEASLSMGGDRSDRLSKLQTFAFAHRHDLTRLGKLLQTIVVTDEDIKHYKEVISALPSVADPSLQTVFITYAKIKIIDSGAAFEYFVEQIVPVIKIYSDSQLRVIQKVIWQLSDKQKADDEARDGRKRCLLFGGARGLCQDWEAHNPDLYPQGH